MLKAKISVKDLMRKDILVTASPEESLFDAVKKMYKNNVGSVVITDKEGKVIGIVTEKDIVRLVASSINFNSRLEEVMVRNPITIHFEEYVHKAFLIMKENNIRHLPVVNKEGKLVGMLSIRDLASLLSTEYIE